MSVINKNKYENIYELSPVQSGLLFHTLYQPESDAYFVQHVFELTNLNPYYWQRAWNCIINRHDALKANFVWEKLSKPLQRIQKEVNLPWMEEDWREVENPWFKLDELIQLERRRSFNLNTAPLMRFNLLRFSDNKYCFLWNLSHLVVDGWSIPILIEEVIATYHSLMKGERAQLIKRRPYKDYIAWLMCQDLLKAHEYWKTKLSGAIPALLSDKSSIDNIEYNEYSMYLNENESLQLNNFAKSFQVTPNSVIQGLWSILLSKYLKQEDLIFGVTVSGRNIDLDNVDKMIGILINTLPVRIQINPYESINAFFKRLQVEMIEMQNYGYLSLSTVQALSKERVLFDSIYVFENYPFSEDLLNSNNQNEKLSIKPISIVEKTEYNLSFAVIPKKEIELKIHYKKHCFSEQLIKEKLIYLKQLIMNVIQGSDEYIGNIILLSSLNKGIQFRRNEFKDFVKKRCVHYLFEEIANGNNDVAIVHENSQLSYLELNQISNRLAHYLRTLGVKPGILIALAFERSLNMVIGILAVLKAGGAYLPIDPDYPKDRIQMMLEDSNPPLLLAQKSAISKLPKTLAKVIIFDELSVDLNNQPDHNPTHINHSNDLAYVIFTSGSTGRPRGVMINHRNIINSIKGQEEAFGIQDHKRILQFASYTFDPSVFEIFLALTSGLTLFLINKDAIYLESTFVEYVNQNKIEVMALPPSFIQAFPVDKFPYLRTLIVGGETPSSYMVKSWGNNKHLFNAYGPTECTVCSSTYHYQQTEYSGIIGKPISNTQIYILDEYLNPLPVGMKGELCIGGEGLARGYLNQPGLTAEKFIPNPFVDNIESNESRLYRTGDMGILLQDGNIEFLGRVDQQVKLRGFRIELSEIETAIQSVEGIVQSVALIWESKEKLRSLLVYAASEKINDFETIDQKESFKLHLIEQCQNACKTKLPDYMQPNQIIILDNLPLNLSGKIDKTRLPEPGIREENQNYQAPEGILEQQLVEIWKTLLRIENIGRNDNFFTLGGDSIISIQMVSRARAKGIMFNVKQVFETPTIAGLIMKSKIIDKQDAISVNTNSNCVMGRVPLIPIQRWFFGLASNVHQFTQSNWILPNKLHGNQSDDSLLNHTDIDLHKLRISLKKIYDHHDAFRMRYRITKEVEQYYIAESPFLFEVIPHSQWTLDGLKETCNKIESSLNIEDGPLTRLVWFEGLGLFWVVHHLIIDGISWRILLEDLNILYAGKALPLKSNCYKDWAEYLQQYDRLGSTYQYYSDMPKIDLPFEKNSQRIEYSVDFSKEITQNFLKKASKAYNTQQNDLLITALVLALGEFTDYKLCIELEGHGRESLESALDLTRIVGWFTSTFPIYLQLTAPSDLGRSIKEIKEQLRRVPDKGITYGIASKIRNQLPDFSTPILFNYLGQWDVNSEEDAFIFEKVIPESLEYLNPRLLHNMDINGQIKDGKLSFIWSAYYPLSQVKMIADNFKDKLELLIEHCIKENSFGRTPSDFKYVTLNQQQLDSVYHQQYQDIYPLSPIQVGLLFQSLYQPEFDSYFIQSIYELENLNVINWKNAWRIVINRHDSLKAHFIWAGLENPVQIISKEVELSWAEEDWGKSTEEDQDFIEQKLQELLHRERTKGFILNKAPLLRFNLIRMSEGRYYFVWNMHHLLTDGWSGAIILKEVLDVYYLNRSNLNNSRPYINYIEWLGLQDINKANEYWSQKLLTVTPTKLVQHADLLEAADNKEFVLVLNPFTTNQINNFAKSIGVTLNALLQGIWAILLCKYTRQTDIVYGAVVSGRNIDLPGIEEMVGSFINTLPIRVKLEPNDTIKFHFSKVQSLISEAQQFGYIPLSAIQSISREGNLFDNIFSFQNYPISNDNINLPDKNLSIKFIKSIEETEYKLSVTVMPKEEIEIRLSYDAKCFSQDFIFTLSKHFERLIFSAIESEQTLIGNISIVDQYDLNQIAKWNHTATSYLACEKCVHELFEGIAEINQDKIALVFKENQLTYSLLNKKSNQLAHFIKKLNNKLESIIGICVPRGMDLIIGFLGILKSGGVYMPLDPEYPMDRIKYMLKDSGAEIILTITRLKDKFEGYRGKIVCLDDEEYIGQPITNLSIGVKPSNLAYIIYTSGSTGNPKGVSITHCSLVNNLEWHANQLKLVEARILQRASSSFDASIWEIALPLLYGHTLVILPDNQDEQADDLNAFITQYECNIMQLTPALIEIFRSKGNPLIEQIVVGGEALTLDQVAIIKEQMPNASLLNVYGATESCIDASYWLVDKNCKHISVGKPIANLTIYILDEFLNCVPIGGIGEIYIGGIGLARGYLNKPGLTAERFVPNLFCDDSNSGSRLYRTGDLGRLDSKGDMEYLGRVDHQVKMRGFRIELGEIETLLQSISGVEKSVASIHEDVTGQKTLLAYIIPTNKDQLTSDKVLIENLINECKHKCKTILPDYMQPSHILLLDKLPLTNNGKIDRSKLPHPDIRAGLGQFEPASNDNEQLICDAFAKTLKIDKIGVHDDFFILGGNSIQAIHLIVALQVNFDIKIKDIYKFRTPKKLAQNTRSDHNLLIRNLHRIKTQSMNLLEPNPELYQWAKNKQNQYLKSLPLVRTNKSSKKSISNILLTGATGFLGCNILNQLLLLTDYHIYLIVRANSVHEGKDRINEKFRYYFNRTMEDFETQRIVVIIGDLEKENIGLEPKEYHLLTKKIDSIIHSAALVKHYGEYESFYYANVQSTINLLEFAKLTKLKDFHYISTCSVLSNGFINNNEGYIYTEDDLPDNLRFTDNYYVKTKLMGEREVVKYRKIVNANIYRVGNLAFMAENSRVQENTDDNAFLSWLKCLFHIKCITKEMDIVEISPADQTAQAIVKIFDKQIHDNGIYHVFNPHFLKVSETCADQNFQLSCVSTNQFVDTIVDNLQSNIDRNLLAKFLLHQGWLDDSHRVSQQYKIFQEKTGLILQSLNFSWSPISKSVFLEYIKQFLTNN